MRGGYDDVVRWAVTRKCWKKTTRLGSLCVLPPRNVQSTHLYLKYASINVTGPRQSCRLEGLSRPSRLVHDRIPLNATG